MTIVEAGRLIRALGGRLVQVTSGWKIVTPFGNALPAMNEEQAIAAIQTFANAREDKSNGRS